MLKLNNSFASLSWKALIVDEAHRLKNIKSRLFEDLASVPRDFCLLLTGTFQDVFFARISFLSIFVEINCS
jgi:SNF2 family DNA or RNA helicase